MKKILIISCAFILSISTVLAKSKTSKSTPAIPPTVVQTAIVKAKPFQHSFQATGSLDASQGIIVTPEVSGRVTHIYFKSGQTVTKGKPLIQLNDEILKAQLEKSQAEYRLQKANYQRYLKLYQKHFFEKAGLDQMKAALDSAKADVNQLKAQLKQTLICAPFSGKLGIRQISIGDYLEPGKAIVSLEAWDPLHANFSIPETYLKNIKIGEKVVVNSSILNHRTYSGSIDALNSVIDKNTRTLDIRATISNPQHELVPGSFANITVYFDIPRQVTVIPQTAVMYSTMGNYVYRVINKKAVKTIVTLGQQLEHNNEVIVTKGLKVGDQIVIGGQMKLQDGVPVLIAKNS